MDRMIHKAMPIFIVEMPERRLSDHGESAANSAQNCYREGSRQCDRLLRPEAVIAPATKRSFNA